MENKLPKIIEKELDRLRLNHAELLPIDGREIYSFSLIDSDGESVPIGLPYLVEVKNDELHELELNEVWKVFDMIREEEEDE